MNYEETQHYSIDDGTPFKNGLFTFTKFTNFTPYEHKTKDEKTFSQWRTTRGYCIERKERIYENVIKGLNLLQKIGGKLIDKIDYVDKRPRDMKHRTEIYTKKTDGRPNFSFEWQDEYDLQKNIFIFLGKCLIENENLIPNLLSNGKQ